MTQSSAFGVVAAFTLLLPCGASAQVKTLPLETAAGVTLIKAKAEPVTHQGKKGLRVTVSEEALRAYTPADGELNPLAMIDDLEFSSGVIEADIAARRAGCRRRRARFCRRRVSDAENTRTYDAFYLRPTNGRADDQVRRNHSAQYISHPAWPWQRLRKETPEKYEDTWTSSRGVDEDQDRGARRARASLRARSAAADAAQRRQDRRAGSRPLTFGRARIIAHFRNVTIRK